MSGMTSYHAGLAAEDQVARHYARNGFPIARTRWRGSAGEIDLIARDGDEVIFVEVKKSVTHARAAERITRAQIERIFVAASEFVADEPKGQLTEIRFDLALVDAQGRIEVIENAFLH